MSLSAFLPILSIVALIVTLLQLLAKPEPDNKIWCKLLILGTLLFCLNVAVEIGKRAVDKRREMAASKADAEQRATSQQLISDVQLLNKSAADAFEKLNHSVQSLPRLTAVALTDQARQVQEQLNTVTQASVGGVHNDGDIALLKGLIEKTQAGIEHLNASVAIQIGGQRASVS
jgi:hypothetical protein